MKIVFVQPAQFFRTERKTNPFFDPIIAVCEKNGIDWELWLPNGRERHGYDAFRVYDYNRINHASIWIYRVLHYLFFLPTWLAYECAGYIFGLLLGKRNYASTYITTGGVFAEFLAGLDPFACVVDVQHGVIYSRHNGYFDRNMRLIVNFRLAKKREFWVYGQGYADCFFKHPDNAKDLRGRVKVIGDVIRAGDERSVGVTKFEGEGLRNVIVFSLQLTADLSRDEMVASVTKMEEFFADFFQHFGDRYVCYVKHHPRFNNVYDLSSFYAKFPQVSETKKQWTELYDQMVLHVTFNSTVTFDCASQGIPTFLVDLPSAKIIMRNFYNDDYGYPYYDKTVDEILELPFEESRLTILAWYHHFYASFSEENCLRLLLGNKN